MQITGKLTLTDSFEWQVCTPKGCWPTPPQSPELFEAHADSVVVAKVRKGIVEKIVWSSGARL